MSGLVLDGVTKRYAGGGRRDRVALRDVSLEVATGEIVAVWGQHRSGRTTLLRVAAGLCAPSEGTASFDGSRLDRVSVLGARGGIGFCHLRFSPVIAGSVVEHVAVPLLGAGVASTDAEARARELLGRTGALACADLEPGELDRAEAIRVAIARALVTGPRMLLVDEPAHGVPPTPRGEGALFGLLRSIAHDDGIAVLMTVEDAIGLAGVDRALTIDDGELRGERFPSSAPVIAFPPRRAEPSA